jgi:large repetitive protein
VTENDDSLACTPSNTGTFSITGTIIDQNGFPVTSNSFSIVVNSDPSVGLSVSPSATDAGQLITIVALASKGTGHYSYIYQNLPLGCSTANSTSIPCAPLTAGNYTIEVIITDSAGGTVTASTSLSVNPDLAIISFTSSSSSVTEGQQMTLSVSSSGGTLPLSYVYTGLPPGCSTVSTANLPCTPSTSGTYIIQVTVTDEAGKTVTSLLGLNVGKQNLVLGLSPLQGYSVIGGIVVAVLAGGVAALLQLRKRGTSPS